LISLVFLGVLLSLAGCIGDRAGQATKTKAGEGNDRLGEMVTVPAGSFLMGNNGHEGYGGPEEFPQHAVYLPTYRIGKYEVTRG
jgi:formylglycine-generating enzyme required for sulfatase activity